MEIRVNKLIELMDLMKPVIPKKPTIKAIAYILVGDRKAVTTDLETMVITDLPEATEPMLLPFSPLMDMLKYVSRDETLKIEGNGRKVTLSWKGGSASYPTEDYQDFPVLPDMPVKAEASINGDVLIPTMLMALPYTASETTKGGSARPVLTGVTLVLGNPLEVAAGDGFRMSHQVLGLSFPIEEKVIVPAHSVTIIAHVFNKTPRTPPTDAISLIPVITAKRQLRLALVGDHKLRVDFGTTASVIVNLIEGNPPEWLALIPQGDPILQSQLFAPQLEAAVKRVRDVAKDGSGIVRLAFAEGQLTVSAQGDDQEISATIDVLNTQGEPGRVGINYSYLLDYLSDKQGIIVLSLYGETTPVVFQYQRSPRVLIMPMHVDWGDQTTAPAEEVPESVQQDPETTEDIVEEPIEEESPKEDQETVPEETGKKKTRRTKKQKNSQAVS